MSKKERIDIIEKIGKELDAEVLTYITSTRKGFDVNMADDSIRLFYNHLNKLGGSCERLALFIYSNGGSGIVPWRLVNLLREHCKELLILVPYKAYSAATLTALGADRIIMHKMGELGPIDPTVANLFNPPEEAPMGGKKGINVEDVSSYIDLIKDDLGINHQDQLIQAFNILVQKVHPLALGNVKRFHSQSKMIAKKLLRKHMMKEEEHKMNEIVKILKSKLFFHGHPINRVEAKELNLKVENPEDVVEKLMWDLYLNYEEELSLNKPFEPLLILNNKTRPLSSKITKIKKEIFDLQSQSRAGLSDDQIREIEDKIRCKDSEINYLKYLIDNPRVDTGLLKGAFIESKNISNVFAAQGQIFKQNPNSISIDWYKKGWELI